MRISELQISKDVQEPNVDWKTIFEKNGWKFLGQGAQATVGQHPKKDYVVKVWKKGSRYELFVPFVQANKNNPHLPVFFSGVKPVPGTKNQWVYIRMEKLWQVYNSTLMSVYYPEMVSLYLLGLKYKSQGMVSVMDSDLVIGIEQHLRSLQLAPSVTLYTNPAIEQKIWKEVGQPDASWPTLVEDLIQDALHKGVTTLDLHEDNFMRRDRTLVIADPYY